MLRLYTFADKRPDFLALQAKSIARYLKDDHELVVFNNAIDNSERAQMIEDICHNLGLRMVRISTSASKTKIGAQRVFTVGRRYRNPNLACAYPINWAWERMIHENSQGTFALIDSDMFFCRPISLVAQIGDQQAGVIMQYRGVDEGKRSAAVSYFWNAFAVFKPSEIPDIEDIKWDCGVTRRGKIEGHSVDVGGYIHYWLRERSLRLFHFAETAIHSFFKVSNYEFLIHFTYNGNLNIEFRYDSQANKILGFKVIDHVRSPEPTWIFPHLPNTSIAQLVQEAALIFCKYEIHKATYGSPTILGFLHPADSTLGTEPFIVHHKAGSGYLGHSDLYLKGKLAFIGSALNLD